ncbi:hypothetical protein MNR02_14795 [Shinella sp. H4-D48]|uniref:hypothetical protein n=1 Tax=Shinella sp. H4-D48 TaxID=2925841 RepID=UPI001F52F4C5|nr:hypothetical protein [Shinella sp. H4-D48]UNK37716.1 hypothetical protein MNR02_14795 [Shinella sp. H4-D48]
MQPDIQSLTARGLKLLGKLGMLSPAERSLVDPYVTCLELYLDETRPAPAQTPMSNVVSFEDATIVRRVQRAEVERRRVAEVRKVGQHRRVDEFGWEVYDDE